MKKGDIAISLVMIVVIVAISMVMLIGIFSLLFPSFGRTMYCNTLYQLSSGKYAPESLRSSNDYCATKNQTIQVDTITEEEIAQKKFLYNNNPSFMAYLDLVNTNSQIIIVELPPKATIESASVKLSNKE